MVYCFPVWRVNFFEFPNLKIDKASTQKNFQITIKSFAVQIFTRFCRAYRGTQRAVEC